MNKAELLSSKQFCLMPWIHVHAWPTGKAFPCCMALPSENFGNTNTQSFAEIVNSEAFKSLRKNMVAGEASKACTRCYELEKSSDAHTLRKHSLKTFSHLLADSLDNTSSDGHLKNFKMAYMDLRFSNLCNFKCRTCSSDFSSSWQEEESPGEKTVPLSLLQNEKFWPELQSLLPDVEEVCFAGGEALISPEHYKILKFWITNKKNHVRLRYTTNFSHFKHKSEDLLSLWNQFSDVRVSASLDANGERGELLRKGTNWLQIEKNRMEMQERAPHVYFEITPTLSVYNAFNLPDFHRDWIEKKLIKPENIRINYLLDPVFMRAQIFSKTEKEKLKALYEKHIEYLEGLKATSATAFKNALSFIMERSSVTNPAGSFVEFNKMLDSKRKENLPAVFPELQSIITGVSGE
ncbi:MAG: twitch domain-containing radical SAM protein [Pseudobdellovibrio sp.]